MEYDDSARQGRERGAGPYKFVSFNPRVELVLEAFPEYLAQGAGGEDAGDEVDDRRDDAGHRREGRRDRARVEQPAAGLIQGFPYVGPAEELKLK